MHKKAFLGLLTDTFDLPQSTLDLGFAPEATMEGDAEAVGFVTDLHQDFQRPGVTVQEQRVRQISVVSSRAKRTARTRHITFTTYAIIRSATKRLVLRQSPTQQEFLQ